MKRIILYIIICALTLLIPVERMDIAKLRPVETVILQKQGDVVTIATDTDDSGQGTDALQALQNMKETAKGIIYLDTAQYLLVSEDAADLVQQLRPHLKHSVTLYKCELIVDTKEVSRYLDIHGNGPKLKVWKTGDSMPVLRQAGERLILSENFEKSY
jgi:hypothetical protein